MTDPFDLASKIILLMIDKLLSPSEIEALKKSFRKIFKNKKKSNQSWNTGAILTAKELALQLEKKYENTRFYIAESETSFYKIVAEKLIEEITECENSLEKDPGLLSAHVRVGLICGPMVYHVADWIDKHRNKRQRDNFREVIFVAMNKAAKLDRYEFSANYLVSFFKRVFKNSNSITYTFNLYDKTKLIDERRKVDILLCSVGSKNKSDNYFGSWYTNMLDAGLAPSALPDDYIGDFCLTPIDANGGVIQENGVLSLVQENLDPYPRFEKHIREAKGPRPQKIIMPISTFDASNNTDAQQHGITGKETASRAILRAGIVDTCILSRALAENLERSIGGYVINKISQESNKGLRSCDAVLLDNGHHSTFSVYDHNKRIDQTRCMVDSTMEPPSGFLSEIPQIIISELGDEAKNYDWDIETGKFEYLIEGENYLFDVTDKEVRRPGQWSLVTMHLARKCLAQVSQSHGNKLSVLDMGCGCGVIGLLLCSLSGDKIQKITFSDISDKALECSQINFGKYYKQRVKVSPEYRQGGLFSVCDNGEKFDVISFNPPFLPTNTPSNFRASDSVWIGDRYIAEIYCEDLYEHLTPGGWGILTAADYFDNGKCKEILQTKFGKDNIIQEDRVILYPCHPKPPIHQAYEFKNRLQIKKDFNYEFEKCFLGGEEFLAFKMRHYLAHRVK